MTKLYAFIVEFLNKLNWLWVGRLMVKILIPIFAYCIIFSKIRLVTIALAILIIIFSLMYYIVVWQKIGENWKKDVTTN